MLREVIREARKRSGLTAKEVSLRLHPLDHSFVSKVERGGRTIDLVEFLDIARAIGADPRELFAAFYDRCKGS